MYSHNVEKQNVFISANISSPVKRPEVKQLAERHLAEHILGRTKGKRFPKHSNSMTREFHSKVKTH